MNNEKSHLKASRFTIELDLLIASSSISTPFRTARLRLVASNNPIITMSPRQDILVSLLGAGV
jgi:hypothetical protein